MSLLSRRVLRPPRPSRPPHLVPLPRLRRRLQPQGWVTDMKKSRFDFAAAVTAELPRLGENPGSSYYAAKLMITVEEANALAEAAGLFIRFRKEA